MGSDCISIDCADYHDTLALRADVGEQPGDHFPRDEVSYGLQATGKRNVQGLAVGRHIFLSKADQYQRCALALHIHGTVGHVLDFCAILNYVPGVCGGEPDLFAPIGQSPESVEGQHTAGRDWQLRVSVGVREVVEDSQAVIFLPWPSVIGRLQQLEDCHSLRRERLLDGSPYMPGFSSALVLPLDIGFPHPPEVDRKGSAVASFRWAEGGHQVLQAGPHVVDRIRSNERYVGVGGRSRELQSVDLSLIVALDPLAQRVWVGGSVGASVLVDLVLEVDEVLFGSASVWI
jgi:hypothetical protein